MRRVGCLLVVALLGCGLPPTAVAPALAALNSPPDDIITPPDELGTRYIAVHGDRLSAPSLLRQRWRALARTTCEGAYITIAESPQTRQSQSRVTHRRYEGFIQCVLETTEAKQPSNSPST